MLDPQSMKQAFDLAGYSLMGLVGVLGAWQRLRSATPSASVATASVDGNKPGRALTALERLVKVEQDLVTLRNRQDEMHQENAAQQSSMLQQQTAMFDLLVQQRTTLDKILAKMSGLL
jgi:hypothetical protein